MSSGGASFALEPTGAGALALVAATCPSSHGRDGRPPPVLVLEMRAVSSNCLFLPADPWGARGRAAVGLEDVPGPASVGHDVKGSVASDGVAGDAIVGGCPATEAG